MKVKLAVGRERYQEVKAELMRREIEIDDNADLLLSENDNDMDMLLVKDPLSNQRVVLQMDDIVLIETFGHKVEVQTPNKTYQALARLYQVLNLLDPSKFLRISNSVVVARNKVKVISPTLSMKFVLTMSNGQKVDVTRSYYHRFREYFGI